jgi:uncharacterized caspase-like protein
MFQVPTAEEMALFDERYAFKGGRALGRFVATIGTGDVALFYYSGHGLQVDGENHLLPIDFGATDEAQVKYQAYSASQVHDRMQRAGGRLNILILDACRDNPFRAARGGAAGWAAMASGRGTLIAFATAPGSTASDNLSESNGLFTKFLLDTLRRPGLKLSEILDRVREQVDEASGHRQVPYTVSGVVGAFIFRDPDAEERRLVAEEAALEQHLKELHAQEAAARQRQHSLVLRK